MNPSMIEQIKSFIAPLIKGQDFCMIDNSLGHPMNTRTLTVYVGPERPDMVDAYDIFSVNNLRTNTTTGEVLITTKGWTGHWDITELDLVKTHIITLLGDHGELNYTPSRFKIHTS